MLFNEAAFTSYQTITEGLSPTNEPNYPFYFNNLFYTIIGIKSGEIGRKASLVQYNSGGSIIRNLTLPLHCTHANCQIEGTLFGLVNNSAYINLRKEESTNFRGECIAIEVDLNLFQVININTSLQLQAYYSLPVWSPYNSTHCLHNHQWFEYSSLSFIGSPTYIGPTPYNIGGASVAMAEQNLIFFSDLDGYNTFWSSQNVETLQEEHLFLDQIGFLVYFGENSTNIAITTNDYFYDGVGLIAMNAIKFDGVLDTNLLLGDFIQSNLFADSLNNLFVVGESSVDKTFVVYQFKVDPIRNNYTLCDQISFVNYSTKLYSSFFSILSWGLNEPTQQFSIALYDNSTQNYAILLVDYDNSIVSY